MNFDRKIDLALEARELAQGGGAARLPGVRAEEDTLFGLPLTQVEILDQQGAQALGRPVGRYLTLDLPQLPRQREEVLGAARAAAAVVRGAAGKPVSVKFRLGWDKKWGTDAYFGDYPCIDREVLAHIKAGGYKGIGFDVIGLDPIADAGLPRHRELFRDTDIVNIENLKNLELCGEELFWFSCFPLKLENCDGSPIRAVAWFE